MPHRMDPLFISWTRENGRSTDLASAMGAKIVNVYPEGGLLRRYLRSLAESRRLLRAVQPDQAVFFMLPPAPLMLLARLVRGRKHVHNIYDLHTGFFYDPKWKWASKICLRMMRGANAIVTNDNLLDVCHEAGVKAHVLHDILHDHGSESPARQSFVLCPVSYSNDEPIFSILDAARQMPMRRWVLTGRAPMEITEQAPANVTFSGYVDSAAYSRLLEEAALVVALTNRKDTMQRAGYEALMRGVPVVTSDFEVLRDFFEDAAVYVQPGESNLVERVDYALCNHGDMATRSQSLLRRRILEQRDQLQSLQNIVSRAGSK